MCNSVDCSIREFAALRYPSPSTVDGRPGLEATAPVAKAG
jgi:hypothetical protein